MTPNTDYHAASWNEPIIYQLSQKGRRGSAIPTVEQEVREAAGDELEIPASMRRKNAPKLPELSEPQVIRHFLRLSQETFGVDSGIHIHGTCTMKYNPKINEAVARSPKASDLHPLQSEDTVQGTLEIMFQLKKWLCQISGMDDFSLQPRGGAHAVFTNALMIRAYHKTNHEAEERNEVITTVHSHPCNGASAALAGYKVITLYPNPDTGCPDIEALKAAASKHTAALMITDPYDTGVFDPAIDEYIKIIHEAGGLVAVDQANANSLLCKLRIGDVGADLCHFNLHKTFSAPHGSTGPGSAPVGVKTQLTRFLPVPTVEFDGSKYHLNYNRPESVGMVGEFYGVVPNILKAYTWIMSMGEDGLREASEIAVLNNNYLIKKLSKVKGITLPWAEKQPIRLQEARFSLGKLKEETGVGVNDVNHRIIDFGIQDSETSHEPWFIPEPLTPEPPESTSLEDIDQFVQTIDQVCREAYSNPENVKNAPHRASITRMDLTASSDSKKWAMTWRAYVRKHGVGRES
ncbi:MAG TPA: aminomethyl-transferring glycine dehydrogenase subunit GcvPB [Candidatus Acidoferrales bacterium]|nr:aminomethyl-transferring glycine dehydrogenase subunit GcvPB [Candidatus Acidoferrales bacterium]